jgi:bifunctional non-homologous end joining protein LigD
MASRTATKLEKYRALRDPTATNEPFGPEPPQLPPTVEGAFVIHLHDATRRHYDVRLEIGGTLSSFACPRGPSFDPNERRLAVHTEDHPIEYLDFEAVIPAGQYGGGPMIVWDRGRVRYLGGTAEEGVARGKLDFELDGIKVKGRFALVKLKQSDKQNEWLLLKKNDAWASKDRDPVRDAPRSVLSGLTVEELFAGVSLNEPISARARELGCPLNPIDGRDLVPTACTQSGAPEVDAEMLYELKLDGVRTLATKLGDDAFLSGRKQRPTTDTYPEVARAIRALPIRRTVLDGEIVAFDERGKPSFHRVASRIHLTGAATIRKAMVDIPVVYVVFDILAAGDYDLRGLPLLERKRLLADLLPGSGVIRCLDYVVGDARPLLRFCEDNHLEGVVAKRASSTYELGPARSPDWIKLKTIRHDDFVIVGFTHGEGARGRFGALDIASYRGEDLVYRGKVGSGFDESAIDMLLASLTPLTVDSPQATGDYVLAPKGRVHVRPEMIVRVRYQELSPEGQVRHPVYEGLRDDIQPRDCTVATRDELDAMRGAPSSARPDPASEKKGNWRYRKEPRVEVQAQPASTPTPEARLESDLHVSNKTKVLWPGEGITKLDLAEYYARIAPWILPYLNRRPIMIVRYPDGITGKSFYQWNVPAGTPSWVRTYRMTAEEKGTSSDVEVFLLEDVRGLVHVANLAAIPIHILAARAGQLDKADFFNLDFDVKGASLREGIELVTTLREVLDIIGLRGFVKTSGQSGLHVFVPLWNIQSAQPASPGLGYDVARGLADLLGQLLVKRHPRTATMERVVSKRGRKVYVDTGQTGQTRTIVAPFSVRAHPGASVSTPLLWDEVRPSLDPRAFTIRTVPDRVASMGDPMVDMLTTTPDVASAVARLEVVFRE